MSCTSLSRVSRQINRPQFTRANRTAEHQDAASKVQATAQDISTKADEHQRLAQAVEQRKAHLNQLESQVSRAVIPPIPVYSSEQS